MQAPIVLVVGVDVMVGEIEAVRAVKLLQHLGVNASSGGP